MDKTVIRSFAMDARRLLISGGELRAYELGLTGVERSLSLRPEEEQQLAGLKEELSRRSLSALIEEAAYTWLNRFSALRFMECSGYLPSRIRVFSDSSGAFKPELLTEALGADLPGLDRERVLELLEEQDNEGLYRYLLLTQCRALSGALPGIFSKGGHWTELLLPGGLLRPEGIIGQMVTRIPEEDWREQVQIVGWLYQFYNAEPKERVFADLKRNVKISAESIPAATQLFTPDWIARYLVDNTLGRLWQETSGERLRGLEFFAEGQGESSPRIRPEEIRLIDPCMGSGHILVYAFDVLMEIYTSQGWPERDAARSILQNNLFGLDIDRRACQLAYFALMMKLRQYDRRALSGNIQPNIASFADAQALAEESLPPALSRLAQQLSQGRVCGSLLEVSLPAGAEEELESCPEELREAAQSMVMIGKILGRRYHTVVTNPPYMGSAGMAPELLSFVKKRFPDYRSDLFSAFVVRCTELAEPEGFLGFLTPYVWMFIQSYEKLRRLICEKKTVETLIQFEYSAFEEATVPICAFVLRNCKRPRKGVFLRLTDFRGGMEVQRQRALAALADPDRPYRYETGTDSFSLIPGMPIAYWVGEEVFRAFAEDPSLGSFIDARVGMVTGDNSRFLRLWSEVALPDIERRAAPGSDPMERKWYPLQKGGDFRRWYGNLSFVVNWENDGFELKNDNFMGSRVRSHNYNGTQQFKEGITWNSITSAKFSCRYVPEGCTFDAAGPLCEVLDPEKLHYILAFLSSRPAAYLLDLINPTLNFPPGYLEELPLRFGEEEHVSRLAQECVYLSRQDWDCFETSMDFQKHPLI